MTLLLTVLFGLLSVVSLCLLFCRMLRVASPYGQQVCMAWRKHIVLDEPERIVGEPATDRCMSMLLYELAEIIRVYDLGFHARRRKRAGLQPSTVDPFLNFFGTGVQCP